MGAGSCRAVCNCVSHVIGSDSGMKIIEAQCAILKADSRWQLRHIVESFIDAAGFRGYDESLSYADNARNAEVSFRHGISNGNGIAGLLRLAAKREKSL